MNVLFTNVGRRTYLIEYTLDLIRQDGYDINVFVADVSIDTAAFYVSKEVTPVITPFVSGNEENYLSELLFICKKNKIDVVVPLMDFELPILSENKDKFLASGTKCWVSDFEVIDNCLDKKKSYDWCSFNGINVPRSYWSFEEALEINSFPVIKKAILGSGSIGLEIIRNPQEIKKVDFGVYFLQDFIEGREIGMDVFNDFHGAFLSAHFREKITMRAGETDKAKSFNDKAFYKMAQHLSSRFRHIGNMDVDFLETENGEIYFIDFNPRFGGGYPFTHHSGLNYLKAIIDISMGREAEFSTTPNEIVGMKGIKLYFYEK